MDVAAVAMWMQSTFGATEHSYQQGAKELIKNSGASVGTILPVQRRKVAQELFTAYDSDKSGFIDVKEFTKLCKKYDPAMDEGAVKQTFKLVNAVDGKLDIVAFYRCLDDSC